MLRRVILRQSVVGLMPSTSAARSRLPSTSRSAASIAALGRVDHVLHRAAAAARGARGGSVERDHVVAPDDAVGRERHRLLDHVLELADVAGEVVVA